MALEALSGGPIVVDRPDPVGNLKKKEGSIQIVIDSDLRQVENSYLKDNATRSEATMWEKDLSRIQQKLNSEYVKVFAEWQIHVSDEDARTDT